MLYRVTFDGEPDYVEAQSFGHAIALWRDHLIETNEPGDFDSTAEPESVEVVHDEPVVRGMADPRCHNCGAFKHWDPRLSLWYCYACRVTKERDSLRAQIAERDAEVARLKEREQDLLGDHDDFRSEAAEFKREVARLRDELRYQAAQWDRVAQENSGRKNPANMAWAKATARRARALLASEGET